MLIKQWDAKDNGGPFRVSQVVDLSPDFPDGGLFHLIYGLRVALVGPGTLAILFEWTDPDGVLQARNGLGIASMLVTASEVNDFAFWKASLADNPAAVFRMTVTKTLGLGQGSQWDGGFKVFG